MAAFPILSCVDAVYVINLPSRRDRRREMNAQLARLGLSFDHDAVTLFPAVRPDGPGEFPSIGARGCFMSHLGVLEDAGRRGLKSLLILEDDADFTPDFLSLGEPHAAAIKNGSWDILYLGYDIDGGHPVDSGAEDGLVRPISASTPIRLTHAMMIRCDASLPLAAYFRTMLTRPAGHPDGGPMHVDGAYSWFRRDHPDRRTAAAVKQWAVQRSSRTDVHDVGWKERIPFINLIRRVRNSAHRR